MKSGGQRIRPRWQQTLDAAGGHDYPAATELNPSALEGVFGIFSQRLTEMGQQILLLRRQIRALELRIDELTGAPRERLVELSSLYNSEFRLLRPLLVNVEEWEDETLARWPAVELTARGTAEGDALMNLGEAIVDLYRDLNNSDRSELGVAPLAWLSILESVIESLPRARA
jgi:hypothetical protein